MKLHAAHAYTLPREPPVSVQIIKNWEVFVLILTTKTYWRNWKSTFLTSGRESRSQGHLLPWKAETWGADTGAGDRAITCRSDLNCHGWFAGGSVRTSWRVQNSGAGQGAVLEGPLPTPSLTSRSGTRLSLEGHPPASSKKRDKVSILKYAQSIPFSLTAALKALFYQSPTWVLPGPHWPGGG